MTLIDRILDNISKNADAKSAIDTLLGNMANKF